MASSWVYLTIGVIVGSIPLQESSANYFPRGNPDLAITINPTYLDKDNFNLLLEDIDRLPVLVKDTVLPEITEEFLKHEDTLLNKYVKYISVFYKINENLMNIDIATEADDFPVIWEIKPAVKARMSVINQLGIFISVDRNSVGSDLYKDTLSKIEDFTRGRSEVLSVYGIETLQKHKDVLLNILKEEASLHGEVPGTFIFLKIIDIDVARVTVTYEDRTTGNWIKAIDETKTGIQIIPEFPVNLMVITTLGLIGALIVVRINVNRVFLR